MTVIDAVDGAREAQTVLVTDGRISSVGPTADSPADAAEVVDGEGPI